MSLFKLTNIVIRGLYTYHIYTEHKSSYYTRVERWETDGLFTEEWLVDHENKDIASYMHTRIVSKIPEFDLALNKLDEFELSDTFATLMNLIQSHQEVKQENVNYYHEKKRIQIKKDFFFVETLQRSANEFDTCIKGNIICTYKTEEGARKGQEIFCVLAPKIMSAVTTMTKLHTKETVLQDEKDVKVRNAGLAKIDKEKAKLKEKVSKMYKAKLEEMTKNKSKKSAICGIPTSKNPFSAL